jgi:hypothetical protein
VVPCAREAVERIVRFINRVDGDLDMDVRESISTAFRELLLTPSNGAARVAVWAA